MLGYPPCQGDPPPGPHPRGKLRGIRSRPPHDYCCGRYASYWNAFLLILKLKLCHLYELFYCLISYLHTLTLLNLKIAGQKSREQANSIYWFCVDSFILWWSWFVARQHGFYWAYFTSLSTGLPVPPSTSRSDSQPTVNSRLKAKISIN